MNNTKAKYIEVSSDGVTIWVNSELGMHGRFTPKSYEFYENPMLGRTHRGEVKSVNDWIFFCKLFEERLDYKISRSHTPDRYAHQLNLPENYRYVTDFEAEGRLLYFVKTTLIAKNQNPFELNPWTHDAPSLFISRENILTYAEKEIVESDFIPEWDREMECSRAWDEKRIAHFINNPSSEPINVSVSSKKRLNIVNGFHRLAANIISEKEYTFIKFATAYDAEDSGLNSPDLIAYKQYNLKF